MNAQDYIRKNSIVDPNTGCWIGEWKSKVSGYCRVKWKGKHVLAHRLSYAAFVGKIPTDQCVLHWCDVRGCVSPYHLFVGTNQDNVDDKMQKGRQARGESHASAKLTDHDVRIIRVLVAFSSSNAALGRHFGVDRSVIWRIKNQDTWRHVA